MKVRICLASLVGALVAVLSVGAVAAAPSAECSNEVIRLEQRSTALPACRAYELVSPVGSVPQHQGTGTFEGDVEGVRASDAQEGLFASALAWASHYPLPGETNEGTQFLSTRTATGWKTADVTPGMTAGSTGDLICDPALSFSADLSHAVLRAGFQSDAAPDAEEEYCGHPSPPLVRGEPMGFQNIYVRDNADGVYSLANLTPATVPPSTATFQGASTDFSHVVFSEAAPLTPNAPEGEALYEWLNGVVHLVSVLPNGTGAGAEIVGAAGHFANLASDKAIGGSLAGLAPLVHAVSADGSRVFFKSGGDLYARVNAEGTPSRLEGPACLHQTTAACSVPLAVPAAGAPEPEFLWATDAGTKVFLSDAASAALTPDTQAGSGTNLYEYDLATGTLTDITPVAEAGVLGFSGLGEQRGDVYAYFVSTAALTGANAEGVAPEGGNPNLYVYAEGEGTPALTFIATLSEEDGGAAPRTSDWGPTSKESFLKLSARVSPDGKYMAFNSVAKPTGYENTPAQPGDCGARFDGAGPRACDEIYLYDAASRKLACVSCGSGTQPPTGGAEIHGPVTVGGVQDLQRNVLDSGQVFFNSAQPLAPLAQNGVSNVYEYIGGTLHLISSGNSTHGSYFAEASPEGANVFFITSQGLVKSDTDHAPSMYDARVDGGFPEPGAPVASCSEERTCQGAAPVLPALSPPGSAQFSGAGDLAPPPSPKHQVRTGQGRGPGARAKRRSQLRRAVKLCVHRYRRSKHRRRACERRARRRYAVRGHRAHHHRRARRAPRHRTNGKRGARR